MVGVDIGGTFTDCVAMDAGGSMTVGKALSTPDDYSVGALNAVRDAARASGSGTRTSCSGPPAFSSTPALSETTRSLRDPAPSPA